MAWCKIEDLWEQRCCGTRYASWECTNRMAKEFASTIHSIHPQDEWGMLPEHRGRHSPGATSQAMIISNESKDYGKGCQANQLRTFSSCCWSGLTSVKVGNCKVCALCRFYEEPITPTGSYVANGPAVNSDDFMIDYTGVRNRSAHLRHSHRCGNHLPWRK